MRSSAEEALVRRTVGSLRARDVRGAISPPSLAIAAAPLLTAALLLFVAERVPAGEPSAASARSLRAVGLALSAAVAEAGDDRAQDPRLQRLAQASAGLAGRLPPRTADRETGGGSGPDDAWLASIQRDLDELLREADPESGLARELERARALALASGMPLTRERAGRELTNDGGERTMSGSTPGSSLASGAPGSDGEGGAAALGPAPRSSETPQGGDEPRNVAEKGVLGGRWWPSRHDEVVEGWIEAQRAAAGREDG